MLSLLLVLPALAEKPKGGRLVVEGPYRVELGDFPAEQCRTVAFKLKNAGDAPIGIMSISRACGCADAFMTTNVVDKGASVGITFKTYPDKLPGTFVKTFYVITDSPDSRTKLVQLVVSGNGIVTKGKGTNGVVVAAGEIADSFKSFPHETHPPSRIRLRWAGENHEKDQLLSRLATVSPSMFNTAPQAGGRDCGEPSIHPSLGYRLDVEFFVQEGCAECLVLRRDYLPALANRYAYRVRTTVSDTHSISTFLRLLEKLEACGIKANEPVYMVVAGEKVLSGWGEIAKRGHRGTDNAFSPAVS